MGEQGAADRRVPVLAAKLLKAAVVPHPTLDPYHYYH